MRGQLVLRCRDATEASAWASYLQPRLADLQRSAQENGLALDSLTAASGAEVVVDFDLSGIESRIEDFFAELETVIEETVPEVIEEVTPPAEAETP